MAKADSNLLQGTLELLILKGLTGGPRHGYAVMSWIQRVTEGALQIEEGALYPALHRLEAKGWTSSAWGLSENNRRAKFYRLTAEGKKRLRREAASWSRYADAVGKILEAEV